MEGNVGATGRLLIQVLEDGILVDTIQTRNLVVNSGLVWMGRRLAGVESTTMGSMLIGSGSRPAAATDTALDARLSSRTVTTTSVGGGIVQYSTTFPEGDGTGTVSEFGLITSGSVLVARALISPQSKTATTTFKVDWFITINAG